MFFGSDRKCLVRQMPSLRQEGTLSLIWVLKLSLNCDRVCMWRFLAVTSGWRFSGSVRPLRNLRCSLIFSSLQCSLSIGNQVFRILLLSFWMEFGKIVSILTSMTCVNSWICGRETYCYLEKECELINVGKAIGFWKYFCSSSLLIYFERSKPILVAWFDTTVTTIWERESKRSLSDNFHYQFNSS